MVRYSEDGNLSFISRKDAQVKIRGQRVELGEIEYRVQECFPETGQVAVEVFSVDDGSPPILAAFIQTSQPPTSNSQQITPLSVSNEVQTQLSQSLPKYMLPTVFFSISEIPKTTTGKTDRRQLRKVGKSFYAETGGDFVDHSHRLGSDKPIFESEQPAYALAEKILSMRPAWGWDGVVKSQSDAGAVKTGFADVLLHSSGLDSINMMSLMHFITCQFKIKVNLKFLIDKNTSARKLAQHVTELQQGVTSNAPIESMKGQSLVAKDFMTEINRHDTRIASAQRLVASQSKEVVSPAKRGLNVFLTGANGFIGTQILRQLLENHQVSRVIALVRGTNEDDARYRTIKAATKALWWTQLHNEKLDVWKGDLSLPQLGLDKEHWKTLTDSKTVDTIIHNGAVVHWGKDYDALETTNVTSTVDLLHIAVSSPSTSFVYVTGGIDGLSSDETEEVTVKKISTPETIGYTQTKFVAEAIVRRAAKRNANAEGTISVLRPGLVVGTPAEGVSNADDFLWRLVAGCLRIGKYDGGRPEQWLDVADVGTVAAATVATALHLNADQETVVSVKDGITTGELCDLLMGMGYEIQATSTEEWLEVVHSAMDKVRAQHPPWPAAHMLPREKSEDCAEPPVRRRPSDGVTPLRLKEAIRKSADFLAKVGFLPLPGGMTREGPTIGVDGAFSRSGLGLFT